MQRTRAGRPGHHRHAEPLGLCPRPSTPEQALARLEEARTHYVDCHCNAFSCQEFSELLEGARGLGFQPFTIGFVRETEPPFLDFIALLEKAQA